MKSFAEFLIESVENKPENPNNLGELLDIIKDEKSYNQNKSNIRKLEKIEYGNNISKGMVIKDTEQYATKLTKKYPKYKFEARFDIDFSETERHGYVFVKIDNNSYIMLRSFKSINLENVEDDMEMIGKEDFSYIELGWLNKNQFEDYMTKSSFISEYGSDKQFMKDCLDALKDEE